MTQISAIEAGLNVIVDEMAYKQQKELTAINAIAEHIRDISQGVVWRRAEKEVTCW